MDNIGQRLKEERQLRGWSQRDLAHKTGVNTDTISGVETGQHEPRPSTLRKLAEGLDIEVRDLFMEPTLPKAPAREAGQPEKERLREGQRAGWQSVARVRSELLVQLAELWDAQLDKGQYDWQTLKAMESAGFRLALNHVLEAGLMKRSLTRDQLAQLERAEKRYESHAHRVVRLLRDVAEEEKLRLSAPEVINLERYVEQREAARQELNITA